MGRPPSNGGPSFRFNPTEVAEMEGILQAHNCQMPAREILQSLSEKFSNSTERYGKIVVQMKQVWNWFQNRRYALRAKSAKAPVKLNVTPMPRDDLTAVRSVPQASQHLPAPSATTVRSVPQVSQAVPAPLGGMVQSAGRNGSDNSVMEFEAKSARDGAWYDVASFLSHRSMETGDPEVLVRFAGFGPEEDEWVNVRKHVRQRSLPCESSECIVVVPNDLILCFQEGKEQALYFDAHVLDAQRRRHDVRGCRCRFLVRYDHDQSEEIVPLRKVCRRPETDYRLQQLHADSANMNQHKVGSVPHIGNTLKVYPPADVTQKQPKMETPAETTQKQPKAEVHKDAGHVALPVSHVNIPVTTSPPSIAHPGAASPSVMAPVANSSVSGPTTAAPVGHSSVSAATTIAPIARYGVSAVSTAAPIAHSSVSAVTTAAPVGHSSVPEATTGVPDAHSSVSGATTGAPVPNSNVPGGTTAAPVTDSSVPRASTTASVDNSSAPGPPTAVTLADSNVPGATASVASFAADVPVATESKVLAEEVSETAAPNNVESISTLTTNLAEAAVTEASEVSGGAGESMQLG